MSYLIDGYNLMHAAGLMATGKMAPKVLEAARKRLLNILRFSLPEKDTARTTVVFDATGAAQGASAVVHHHEIEVRFAVRHQQADDVIEELIRRHSSPRSLTVVSDDRRLKDAARRRHCQIQDCQAFLQWLAGRRKSRLDGKGKGGATKP